MQTNVKVLGGLEITVEFTACSAEPDVGIMSDYFEDWSICEIAGRPLRKKESPGSFSWFKFRISLKLCQVTNRDKYHAFNNLLAYCNRGALQRCKTEIQRS